MRRTAEIHSKYELPGTLFIVGRLLERDSDVFRPYVTHKWLDFQQHTYDHTSLKPVVVTRRGKVELFDFPTLLDVGDIKKDIRKTNLIFQEKLGVKCRGLSTPFAYFMGLADRPDIVKALHAEGIRYVRSFHLNKEVFEIREPLPFDYHPFDYGPQGCPDMLEFCIKGYSDVTWALRFGWDAAEGFVSYVKQALHTIEKTDSVWGLVVHDWSLYKIQNDFQVMEEILHYARQRDIKIVSFNEAYEQLLNSALVKDSSCRKVDWKVNFVREP
jgi:peptidoglycan/xylan/chitin deacetylase (PgdA/CDA1 family)